MEPAFNPAAVGKEDKLNIVGSYAMDFAGFENNPKVLYIGADMPFYFARTYHGAGLSLLLGSRCQASIFANSLLSCSRKS